jgi:hypothetical protein
VVWGRTIHGIARCTGPSSLEELGGEAGQWEAHNRIARPCWEWKIADGVGDLRKTLLWFWEYGSSIERNQRRIDDGKDMIVAILEQLWCIGECEQCITRAGCGSSTSDAAVRGLKPHLHCSG